MRIVMAGGTGFLGSALAARLRAERHRVTMLTRRPRGPEDVQWDPGGPADDWAHVLDEADTVVNLAGESIAGGRWTPARKAALRDSRIRSTRALVEGITRARRIPPTFLNASAVGIYGPHGDERLTEDSPPGSDFLAALCGEWEAEAMAADPITRVVLLRSGLVLHKDGGALGRMALPFYLLAGGPLGSGRQYISWIHRDDWIEMVSWALESSVLSGAVNLTAPSPVTNREFARALGRVLHRPSFMPAPAFALRAVLGEMADAILTDQRVIPARVQSLGFEFRYPRLEPALRAAYARG